MGSNVKNHISFPREASDHSQLTSLMATEISQLIVHEVVFSGPENAVWRLDLDEFVGRVHFALHEYRLLLNLGLSMVPTKAGPEGCGLQLAGSIPFAGGDCD